MTAPVLNELSLEPADLPTLVRMTSLAAVLKRLDLLGFPRVLRQTRDAIERDLEGGVSLRAWLFRSAPRDLRQFLAGRLSRPPFVEELHQEREDVSGTLLHVSFDGAPASGVGIAHLHEAPAIALRGIPRWEVDPLVVLLARVGDDGNLAETSVEVIHLSCPEQVDSRAKVLRDRLLRTVEDGDDLWQRRVVLFPRLDFCESVERQARALTGNELHFYHVVQALSRLDAALEKWESGPLHPGMDSSGESSSTLSHAVYGPMRDFLCPDRQTRRFKNHLKLFSGNWRIYYWEARPAGGAGRAFVGYMGAHLPTVNYPT